MTAGDPSAVAVRNGQFLGLEWSLEQAQIALLPLPWDVTTSYRPGTVNGPQAIIDASYQLDLFHPRFAEVHRLAIHTLPVDPQWVAQSARLRTEAEKIIQWLESGQQVEDSAEMRAHLKWVNEGGHEFHAWSKTQALQLLKSGKKVVSFGGDHSVSLGPIQAASEFYQDLSILHFDAHADLRKAYEGFQDSHASIMYNVLQSCPAVTRIVQVGIRDVSPFEINLVKAEPKRLVSFYDWQLQEASHQGIPWHQQCARIVEQLGAKVYISFDIDGLDPKLCPHTGTPVPGGLEFAQAIALINAVLDSGRTIVGADLVEVAPGPEGDEWDANVGARLLFQLVVAVAQGLVASDR